MATGSGKNDGGKPIDEQGGGQSAGVPADGEVEGNSFSPLGRPGMRHWQASYITEPGLNDRSSVFFAAVEMTRMPMVVTDPNQDDNPIVFVNRAFLDMTGYEENAVLGRNCRFLQGPETDRDTVREVREAIAEQRAVAVDLLNYKADGKPFWNALFLGPIFDKDGKILYFFASQMDITRRRVSEQSFRQAQKMEAIGQLTAGLAHDFNNLLQVITGNLEVAALHCGDNRSLRTAIGQAELAAARGGKLTQQLLTFARKQRLDPKRISLNALVVEFSEMLVRTLGESIDLRLDLKPGLPSCRLDPTHMEMALLNVLINARDALPGGGRVTIATAIMTEGNRATAHHLPPGPYVMLCVIDEGEGMPAEVLQRATEPFFTTKGMGTGLGLAMVHGFVQQSQGRLEIDSKPGEGTTVRMIFPLASERDAARNEPERAEKDPDAPEGARSATQTILLAEDSEDVRQVAANYLRSLGYRVLAAHSGEEALVLLERQGRVDLLFTDLIMPGGMNGLILAERVRQSQPELPVLLTTGFMDELVRQGSGAFGKDILTKPYRRSELAERVRAALAKQHPDQPPTTPGFRHEG